MASVQRFVELTMLLCLSVLTLCVILVFNSVLNVLITFIIVLVCFLGFWANKQRHKMEYDNQTLEMI